MFAQTFVEGPARTSRGWTVVLSCCLQITIILVMVAVPLLRPEVLPRSVSTIVTIAPPPAPPPPPPPQPQIDRPRVRPRPSMVAGRLVFSRNSQKLLIDVADPPDNGGSGSEGGVEGGFLGGPASPLVNSVVKAAPPVAPPPTIVPAAAPKPEIVRINVGGRVQEALLINKVIPAYPPLAIRTRTSGVVRFTAVISREGMVTNLTLVSGHPLLVEAATNAVRQWRYKPTFLNGDPVEVVTTIDVNFVLGR